MTRTGRKPQGVRLLSPLSGSEFAKRRMALFIQTLAGETSVVEACKELQIGESRFYGQRAEWLQAALDLLEPRSAGRPHKVTPPPSAEEVERLREQLRETEARASAFAVKAELAGALRVHRASCAAPKKTK